MALPNVAQNDILRVDFRGLLHGQRIINSYYYRAAVVDGANPSAGYDALEQAFDNGGPMGAILPACSFELDEVRLRVQKILPSRMVHQDYVPMDDAGLNLSESLPSTVSAVLSRRTNVAAKYGRGRIFMAGVPLLYELDSKINAAGIAAYNAVAAACFFPQITSGNWAFSPVHYQPSQLVKTVPIDFYILNPNLRVQRRREVGVGE